ncbi:hypothetical protein Drorol1_Dr00027536, partial [Drosera rotundifolia]
DVGRRLLVFGVQCGLGVIPDMAFCNILEVGTSVLESSLAIGLSITKIYDLFPLALVFHLWVSGDSSKSRVLGVESTKRGFGFGRGGEIRWERRGAEAAESGVGAEAATEI